MIPRSALPYRSFALTAALLAAAAPASATSPPFAPLQASSGSDVGSAISAASLRFGVPASWVRAVIRVESRGNALAVSPKGAIGLMQLTPATYDELRQRLGLGADPYAVRDNVMAGTAYLRDMLDRYGVVGMMGAYNAGPARWAQHLAGARPLPQETVGYIAALAPLLATALASGAVPAALQRPKTPAEAPIFVSATGTQTANPVTSDRQRVVEIIARNPSFVIGPTEVSTWSSIVRRTLEGGLSKAASHLSSPNVDPTGGTLFIAPTGSGAGP